MNEADRAEEERAAQLRQQNCVAFGKDQRRDGLVAGGFLGFVFGVVAGMALIIFGPGARR